MGDSCLLSLKCWQKLHSLPVSNHNQTASMAVAYMMWVTSPTSFPSKRRTILSILFAKQGQEISLFEQKAYNHWHKNEKCNKTGGGKKKKKHTATQSDTKKKIRQPAISFENTHTSSIVFHSFCFLLALHSVMGNTKSRTKQREIWEQRWRWEHTDTHKNTGTGRKHYA